MKFLIHLLPFFILLSCNQRQRSDIAKSTKDTASGIHPDSLTILEESGNSCYIQIKKNNPAIKYAYDSAKQIHNYSGNWDFDGDGNTDSLFFIGNGGAHLYFHLSIILSSEKRMKDFPFLEFDMPCLGSIDELKKASFYPPPSFPQFVVSDFDGDGFDEIYLNLDTMHSPIPNEWRKKGLTSRYILIDFKAGELIIKNFLD